MAENVKAKKTAAKPKTAAKSSAAPAKETKSDAVAAQSSAASPEAGISLDASSDIQRIVVKSKGKGYKGVTQGVVHIKATFNNTQVSITDLKGNVIGWSSAGKCGFRGSKKSTAYVAQLVAQDACRQAMQHGLKEVEVLIKGPGTGRESAVRALQMVGLEITIITDNTPVPHNGCRLRKQRRV